MTSRRAVALLALVATLGMGATVAQCPNGGPGGGALVQTLVTLPGYAEPHTPGAGGPLEIPASANVQALLGPQPDLNRVTYLRTAIPKPSGAPPRAILILVPGFLGGAATFAPLARQLVLAFNGNLEVWAIDRRPNQLEDERGALHALAGAAAASTPAERFQALEEGTRFYFAETPTLDINQNGVVDPQFELPDANGVPRPWVHLSQDDMRFAAYWGIDTYMRDWKILVDRARSIVGPEGLVLFGGHSMGTSWASAFAAYDFDPDPAHVVSGHSLIDGLLLLEGGGLGAGTSPPPTHDQYLAQVASLASQGGPDVTLSDFQGIDVPSLGATAEISGIAGVYDPDAPALSQRTPLFGNGLLSIFFRAPATNRSIVGLFIDDDFEPVSAFRASVGFSSNGPNIFISGLFGGPPFYTADPNSSVVRTWQDFDDPSLPTCPPNDPTGSPGCAIQDLGPRPAPTDPPRNWGREAEVSSLDDVLHVQFENGNFVEWYFVSGRVNLDFSYGRDSSALGDESLLALTQNASMDKPVLCIGGSNGLAPLESSFAGYLGSIATPPTDQEIVLLEGYAHLDVVLAHQNAAVPPIRDWVDRLLQRKLLGTL